MSVYYSNFAMKAKAVVGVGVLVLAAGATIIGSECSRAEGEATRPDQGQKERRAASTAAQKEVPLPQRTKSRKPSEPVARVAAATEDKGEPAGQLQPQVHASNAGITTCFDSLARASSHVIDGPHRAFSFWDPRKANTGTFRSVVSLSYGGNVSPRGAALIINSPLKDESCDATTVQVVPTSRPCSAIQASLIEKGKAAANLAGLALIQTPAGINYLLLPTAGDGCTIVSMTVIRGN